jgi:hypothetical protein
VRSFEAALSAGSFRSGIPGEEVIPPELAFIYYSVIDPDPVGLGPFFPGRIRKKSLINSTNI